MGKKAPSAPPPPDPAAAATAQAKANRISQFTPQGNLIFGKITPEGAFALDPSKSEAASQVQETPFQGAFRKTGEGAALQLASALAPQAGGLQQIDLSGLPNFGNISGNKGNDSLVGDFTPGIQQGVVPGSARPIPPAIPNPEIARLQALIGNTSPTITTPATGTDPASSAAQLNGLRSQLAAAQQQVSIADVSGEGNSLGLEGEQAKVDRINQQIASLNSNATPFTPETTNPNPEFQSLQDQLALLPQTIPGQGGGLGGGVGGQSAPTVDFSGDARRVEDATFQRLMDLLNPEFARQQRDLETNLVTRGLPLNSEAASGPFGELTRFERGRNEALTQAGLQSVTAGRAEQSRLAQLLSQTRAQTLGEQQNIRQSQIAELASIIGGQQFNPTPSGQFFAPGQIDILGPLALQNQSQLANFNAQNQARQSGSSNLASFGGSLASAAILGAFSAKALKINKRPISEILPRIELLPVEAWEYVPEVGDKATHIGPYAEDFRRLFGVGDGLTINTIDAFGVCFAAIKELNEQVRWLEARNG